jgi:lipopolysaccharide transport system permease protein
LRNRVASRPSAELSARDKRKVTEEKKIQELVIEAGRAERQYWHDLWRYRELFYFLAWRDILVRYKQTVIGVAWSLVRPLLTMIIFTFLFKKVVKVPDDGIPYPLTAFAGVLAWNFFATSLQDSGNSLVTNANLVSKVYFPRLVVPAATVITAFVDFLISALLMGLLLAWFQFAPSPKIVLLPVFILMSLVTAVGCGLWVSALMVKFRDVRFIVPFIVQFGLYVSPVGFKTSIVPEEYRLLFYLNPLTAVIDGFRHCILGGPNPINGTGTLLSGLIGALLIISGIHFFRKTERSFADMI